MSCTGSSCQQGRKDCTDLCDLSDEEFDAEMNRRAGDLFISLIGVFALALWAAGVLV